MILLDLFSGYGGFHKGLCDAGFKFDKVYFSEINKHAIANYRYNYEKSEYTGSIEHILERGIERPDIITFGSPCQGFSQIGERTGIYHKESCLIKRAIAAVAHFRPSVYIWENVKGMSSSNGGADFIAIMQEFAKIDGYGLEGQLVNTIWWLPQNRERYFIVGVIADRCKGQIFPVGRYDKVCANETSKFCGQSKDYSTTIRQSYGDQRNDTYIISYTADKLRRLTEIECERLQGLPDDWTRYGNYDGEIKEISATQRYKMIGNGVTVKVVEEIGKSILKNII